MLERFFLTPQSNQFQPTPITLLSGPPSSYNLFSLLLLKLDSLQDTIAVPWKSLPRRVCKLYLALRVIEKYEETEGRSPGDTSAADLANVQKLRKELCDTHSIAESQIPDSLLERLLEGRTEFPPVCDILGGILGQKVIKSISGKGDPLKNFFFFDAKDGKGSIEDIAPQKA